MPPLDLEAAAPPAELAPALQALWWLKKGGLEVGPVWDAAHTICQAHEGTRAFDLVHGLAHRIEGDDFNADYWYRRAGDRGREADLAREWERLIALIE